jgi:hypothetical protein
MHTVEGPVHGTGEVMVWTLAHTGFDEQCTAGAEVEAHRRDNEEVVVGEVRGEQVASDVESH